MLPAQPKRCAAFRKAVVVLPFVFPPAPPGGRLAQLLIISQLLALSFGIIDAPSLSFGAASNLQK